MRKFIISDIHGNGNLYYSIIKYIENISKNDNVTLYINGDLIDRGLESGEILIDIINRINNVINPFKIVYLAGNHELMMYKVFEKRKNHKYVSRINAWFNNGGSITDKELSLLLNDEQKTIEIADFISKLDLYHVFKERINAKNIILTHACSPIKTQKLCNIKIKDMDLLKEYYVWAREDDLPFPLKTRIGNKQFFSIVGHTPNNNPYGYSYSSHGNYLNIDGGSAYYVTGCFEYEHFPLVEIKDDHLRILTFNNNNEIIYGNYFKDNKSIPFTEEEMEIERNYLNKDFKPKKLVRLKSGNIGYQN